MNIVLLLSNRREVIQQCKDFLSPDVVVVTASSPEDCLENLGNCGADALLLDCGPLTFPLATTVDSIQKIRPNLSVIAIFPSEATEDEMGSLAGEIYDYLKEPLSSMQLRETIHRAFERQRLLEVNMLCERSEALPSPVQGGIRWADDEYRHPVSSFSERAMRELSKALTARFDLSRLLNLFVDSVADGMGISKISAFLMEEGGIFRIKASRGIKPDLAANLQFRTEDALPLWLSREGRILRRSEVLGMISDPVFRRLARQIEILQCVISVPFLNKGTLVGFLNLNQKVTGIPFTNDELEILFALASHMAVAIQDILFYQQMYYQKTYSQKILAHMSNGVVAIDTKERITIYNFRAEQILGRSASEMLGKDLRYLPSPLGDLLYQTMREGKATQKEEVRLFQGKVPLEISSYPLADEQQRPMGSVILFEDISSRKKLEEESRRADRLNLLNELLARMAHEIKNPLVSIRTFIQLMHERYEDQDFRGFFYNTVSREAERINDLVEKLIAFVQPLVFHYDFEDLNTMLDNSLFLAWERGIPKELQIIKNFSNVTFTIRADKEQMSKAFSYIVLHVASSLNEGGELVIETEEVRNMGSFGSSHSDPRGSVVRVSFRDNSQGMPLEDLEKIFDPFRAAEGFGACLGLPVSQKIIEEHGGRVEVESEIGRGTTFHVYLPFVTEGARSTSIK